MYLTITLKSQKLTCYILLALVWKKKNNQVLYVELLIDEMMMVVGPLSLIYTRPGH